MKKILSIAFMLFNFSQLFANELYSLKNVTKYGYIDKSGSWVIKPQFDMASSFSTSDNIAAVELNNKCGYINKSGEWVIKPKFKTCNVFSNGFAIVRVKKRQWRYIDKSGRIITIPKSTNVHGCNYNPNTPLVVNYQNKKYGYIDIEGNWILEPIFDDANCFTKNGLALVKSNGKNKFIDKTGKVKIKIDKGYVSDFKEDGLARIDLNGATGAIDKNGNWVIKPIFDFIGEFSKNGLATARIKGGNSNGYINKKSIFVIKEQFNNTEKFVNGFAVVKINNKYGYIDKSGDWAIKPQYDSAYSFHENGLATVKLNGKTGIINTKGEWILKPIFKFASVYNNLISVDFGEYEGYTTLNGKYLTFTETEVYNANLVQKEKKKKISKKPIKKKSTLLGKHVCSTWSNGKNGWCGDVTGLLGDSIRVENYRVFCGSGGFLGICTNINTGSYQLFTSDSGENYKNPRSIIVSKSSID